MRQRRRDVAVQRQRLHQGAPCLFIEQVERQPASGAVGGLRRPFAGEIGAEQATIGGAHALAHVFALDGHPFVEAGRVGQIETVEQSPLVGGQGGGQFVIVLRRQAVVQCDPVDVGVRRGGGAASFGRLPLPAAGQRAADSTATVAG